MNIDAHQHFWRYSPATHAWIDDSMSALRRDFLPDDLAPLLRASGFDGSIAVQAQQDIAETEWLLALAAQHDFIRGVVGWVDLRADDVRDQLARLASDRKLRGIRHVVQDEPDDAFMLRPDFQHGIAALEAFDLTYDILIYPRQLPAVLELARAFPHQRFILDHIAKADIRNGVIHTWAPGLRALAALPNVACKLSGMVTEADWRNWRPEDFAPYLDIVLEAFGPARLMIGSDWPVCTVARDYAAVTDIVRNHIATLTPDEQSAILGQTAARTYKL